MLASEPGPGSRTNRSQLQSEEEIHPSHEFQTKRKVKMLTTANPGADNGRIILVKAPNLEQPSIIPDSSRSLGMESKKRLQHP
jgi:hypothetical protein